MSEQESNICPICGGVKRVEYTIGFEDGRPRDMSVKAPEPLPEIGWRICPGHPEPTTDVVSPWLREQVLLAIGRASVCWRVMPIGTFDDAQAKEIAEQLIQAIASERGQHVPEPIKKHDGGLYPGACVYHDTDGLHRAIVSIDGKYRSGPEDTVSLSPKQALSLLAWLRQEEAELERLAKEQERG